MHSAAQARCELAVRTQPHAKMCLSQRCLPTVESIYRQHQRGEVASSRFRPIYLDIIILNVLLDAPIPAAPHLPIARSARTLTSNGPQAESVRSTPNYGSIRRQEDGQL